nr:hypothetical protein [Acidiferrobacterales bacterium]
MNIANKNRSTLRNFAVLVCAFLVVLSYGLNAVESLPEEAFKELDWTELMPPMDRESLLTSPIDPFSNFEDTG